MFRRHSLNLANWALSLIGLVVAFLTVMTLPMSESDGTAGQLSFQAAKPVVNGRAPAAQSPAAFSPSRDFYRPPVPQTTQTAAAPSAARPTPSKNPLITNRATMPVQEPNRRQTPGVSSITIGSPVGARPSGVRSTPRYGNTPDNPNVRYVDPANRPKQLNPNTIPQGMSQDF